jgi:hypothetical protein
MQTAAANTAASRIAILLLPQRGFTAAAARFGRLGSH